MFIVKPELLSPLLFSAIGGLVGAWLAYSLNIKRDRQQKRRDLTVKYLIEAYRHLERAAGHRLVGEVARGVETAVGDVQLFGSPEEVISAQKFALAIESGGGADVGDLLRLLRRRLRAELALDPVDETLLYYRSIEGLSDRP